MAFKHFTGLVLAAAIGAATPARVQADNLVPGLIIGGIIACGLTNCAGQNNRRATGSAHTQRRTVPQMSAEQRQQNREVQSALNYFNYPVGTVDGSLGARSRDAISRFQGDMGFAADGKLDDYEREFLVGSYNRGISGNMAPYQQAFQTQGPRGLLYALNDERRGIVPQQPQVAALPAAPAPTPAVTPAPTPAVTPVATPAPAPVQVAEPAPAPAPPIFDVPQVQRSVAQLCTDVNVQATAMTERTTPETVSDPKFALNEQFCLARDYAISASSTTMQSMPGETDQSVETKCAQLDGWMSAIVAKLPVDTPDAIITQVSQLATGAGTTIDALIPTGKLCLGSAYRTDNPKIAVSAALIMVAAGQEPYGEIVGHHLHDGYGATAQPGLANQWYDRALTALEGGAVPVFLPNQSDERVKIMRRAMELGGST